jgi:DNA-binding transcriptional LysR family regulator
LPAVSRQLRALEVELGASLIVRSTRRLRVTDAGQGWYERCKRVLREIDEGGSAARRTKGVNGRLVVSAPLTFGASIIVPRLPKLSEQHPQLVIDLRLEDQLIDLVAEGVDAAVRAGSPPPDSTAFAGVAYLPDWLVGSDIEQGTLRRVLPKWSSSPITAWLIHRSELRGAPRIRAFLDAMPKSSADAVTGLAVAERARNPRQ